jgi:hypothetical protein
MNEVQRRAIAAGFLHAMQTTPALYSEWSNTNQSDDAAVGALIQKTMGLTQAPSKDDLHAMAQYIDGQLGAQVKSIQASNAGAPSHVGFIYVMQQSS